MVPFFHRRKDSDHASSTTSPTLAPELTKPQLKRATRTRKTFSLLCSAFLFISVIFLILVEIAGTYNRKLIRDWFFIRLDLSHIIPASVPNFALINTIAQTLGLHDFYQVGLWGFCEGYKGQGVTYCSKPETLYWFNPVQILRNELLAGASINLPADINDILDLIKLASQVMFGLFLTSAVLSFVLIFIMPFSIYSRWLTLPIAILTFLNALFCTAASIVATVMFVIFRNVIGSVKEINIKAEIGVTMFAFMWVASAFTIFAWLVQTGLCCCCATRRDVKTGRKRGNEKAYQMQGGEGVVANGAVGGQEKKGRKRFRFGKKSV
ncbi:SUR7/PalI family-domain-containing protein [Clohesyomyces aquaticus]|uniref:SUR7/PalI family-domain-containing protein n=1 Tax=Clohesyomyces aquaticus TaxID=1231657 RepID=A0A1Y1ZH91_9PLEO|nr:SUR7/PalI family-domain-containing protein [Clohesyomyces aquaticus]